MGIPAPIAKLLIGLIGSSMWLWMKGYVTMQILIHGKDVLIPLNRTTPPQFTNDTSLEHKFANVNDIRMHYVMKGCENNTQNRPVLLMLHGFLDFWYTWNRQIDTLSQNFCVVVPDLRGYGNTTKPQNASLYLMKILVKDIKEFIHVLEKQNMTNITLIGHDWGGMISFVFASLHEHMISKMIIINGMHPLAFGKRLFESVRQMIMSWYMLPFRRSTIPEQYIEIHDFKFFEKIHKQAFTKEEEDAAKYVFSQNYSLTASINYYRAFNTDADQLKKFDYKTINVSTLILWGEKDEFITTPVAEYNRQYLRNSSVLYYPNAGHWVLRECPYEITSRIEEFVQTGMLMTTVEKAALRTNSIGCSEALTPSHKKSKSTGVPGTLERVTVPPGVQKYMA